VLENVASYHQQQRRQKLRKSLTYTGGELSFTVWARGDDPTSTSVEAQKEDMPLEHVFKIIR
jgi:1,2-diacylglycerol 3-beta-galactosyltransferase